LANLEEPRWKMALNEAAVALGGPESLAELNLAALYSLVDLSPGLEKVGADLLVESIRMEAHPTALGIIMARIEMIRALRALKVLRGFLSHDSSPPPSIFIVGGPRSGTSWLLRLLSTTPGVRAPYTYELLYPEHVSSELRLTPAASTTIQDALWDEAAPEFGTHHHNSGELPAECLPFMNASFQSHHWTGCYHVPTYREYLKKTRLMDGYSIHLAFAKLLAGENPGKKLLFKSPAHALAIESLHNRYPDGRFIYVYRDPTQQIRSYAALLHSIRRMRSNHVTIDQCLAEASAEVNDALENIERFCCRNSNNMLVLDYARMLADPARAIQQVSKYLDLEVPLTPELKNYRGNEQPHRPSSDDTKFGFTIWAKSVSERAI